MRWTILLHEIDEHQRHAVGGKGFALARMAKSGFQVPPALCITTEAYHEYATANGFRERIHMELHRKDFREMRWEEVWDSARTSFAGLHESFVNVTGTDSIIEHVRLVWASLWSDDGVGKRSEHLLGVGKPEENAENGPQQGAHGNGNGFGDPPDAYPADDCCQEVCLGT